MTAGMRERPPRRRRRRIAGPRGPRCDRLSARSRRLSSSAPDPSDIRGPPIGGRRWRRRTRSIRCPSVAGRMADGCPSVRIESQGIAIVEGRSIFAPGSAIASIDGRRRRASSTKWPNVLKEHPEKSNASHVVGNAGRDRNVSRAIFIADEARRERGRCPHQARDRSQSRLKRRVGGARPSRLAPNRHAPRTARRTAESTFAAEAALSGSNAWRQAFVARPFAPMKPASTQRADDLVAGRGREDRQHRQESGDELGGRRPTKLLRLGLLRRRVSWTR